MEYIKVMEIRQRVCDKYTNMELCKGCPLRSQATGENCGCNTFITRYPEQAEAILKKWDEENPVKTFLSDFLEKYPKVTLKDNGTPKGICPSQLEYCEFATCNGDCVKCWNRHLESEEK